ncbi:hypothetical protein NVIE_2725 [Nitrososphaera viennensis EN76]|uniref:Uncharacterized protein n=1 Tax=Nitrososphaera viennensis EN76 TaxID=926571 RepID=A0A060HKA3_9ARCH|nr:hypothetical protein NVIE_2725 [Nitrososphaera viennensis EN76]
MSAERMALEEYEYALQQARLAHGEVKKWIIYAGEQLEIAGVQKEKISTKLRNDLPGVSADYISQICSQMGWTDRRFPPGLRKLSLKIVPLLLLLQSSRNKSTMMIITRQQRRRSLTRQGAARKTSPISTTCRERSSFCRTCKRSSATGHFCPCLRKSSTTSTSCLQTGRKSLRGRPGMQGRPYLLPRSFTLRR